MLVVVLGTIVVASATSSGTVAGACSRAVGPTERCSIGVRGSSGRRDVGQRVGDGKGAQVVGETVDRVCNEKEVIGGTVGLITRLGNMVVRPGGTT